MHIRISSVVLVLAVALPSAAETDPGHAVTSASLLSAVAPNDIIAFGSDVDFRVGDLARLEDAANNQKKVIGLFVDDVFIPDVVPFELPEQRGVVRMHLVQTPKNQQAWSSVFASTAPMHTAALGSSDGSLAASGAVVKLEDVSDLRFELYVVFLVVFFGLLFLLKTSSWFKFTRGISLLICDYSGGPYSLAKTQMLFWFVALATCFWFVFRVTGSLPWATFPGSMAPLLGISVSTLVGAGVASQGKPDPAPGRNFFEDILTDQDGVTLPRIQMVIWTVVLGASFIYSVSRDLVVPEYSPTLLGLMGISSGTYVTLKVSEQQPPKAAS